MTLRQHQDPTWPGTRVVGAALVDSLQRPTRLLVARRSYPEALVGQWELPGGKVEPGEEAGEALRRELAEELGVSAELGPECPGPGPWGWPLGPGLGMRVFLGVVRAGTCRALGSHDRLAWMPLDQPAQILALPWIPADRPILDALLHQLDGPQARAGVRVGHSPMS